MNTTTDFDRLARRWLQEGPTELADRVLDAALDEVRHTPQRRAYPTPWRALAMSFHPTMTMGRAAAGILVATVALGGAAFVLRPSPAAVQPSSSPAASPSTLPTLTGVSVSGWIVGSDGAPYGSVLDRRVNVTAAPPGKLEDGGVTVNADEMGRFDLRLTPGRWELWVMPVFGGTHGSWPWMLETVDVGTAPISGVRIVYRDPDFGLVPLTGRVTDAAGHGVEASITLRAGATMDKDPIGTVATDRAGRWSTMIQPGVAYCLEAVIGDPVLNPTTSLGNQSWQIPFGPSGIPTDPSGWTCAAAPAWTGDTTLGPGVNVDLRLPPLVTAHVRIVDANGRKIGSGTPGLRVSMLYAGMGDTHTSTRFGPDGTFVLNLFQGQWRLSGVYASGTTGGYLNPVPIEVGTSSSQVVVHLPVAWTPSPAP